MASITNFLCLKPVTLGCGGVANQNCTFFQSSVGATISSGSCGIKVCKCSSDICQVIKKSKAFIKKCLFTTAVLLQIKITNGLQHPTNKVKFTLGHNLEDKSSCRNYFLKLSHLTSFIDIKHVMLHRNEFTDMPCWFVHPAWPDLDSSNIFGSVKSWSI